ncbi:hypothetical protein MTY66_12770 [Mycolicibacterium sp. TY66]|nr:hypothetical protein MTY66_12770 [Mycolicibacterium sp. TY66]BCJ82682.1 hypothetical protein MTY81_40550 [Mycolicibacterium sp. TY81]GCA98216.1 hypothetical protein NCCNTM_18510 [Mycolicibacterium sp. NCC-Tsukiji]
MTSPTPGTLMVVGDPAMADEAALDAELAADDAALAPELATDDAALAPELAADDAVEPMSLVWEQATTAAPVSAATPMAAAVRRTSNSVFT